MKMSEEQKEVLVNEENKQLVAQQPYTNQVADLANGIYSTSDTFNLAQRMAVGLSKSTLVPLAYQNNPANCLVALEMANRSGQSPLQVMQSLDVIQGTPAWRGKALIAMINNSRKYDEDLHFEYEEKDGKNVSCYAWTMKDGRKISGTKYTLKMAEDAGLLKKNNSYWLKEPDLMLAYRATSRFCSLNCPEISLGLYTKEEVIDFEIYQDGKKSKKTKLNDAIKSEEDVFVEAEVVG